MKDGKINDLLFVIGVAGGGKLGKNGKKKKKKYAGLWLMWPTKNKRKKKWDMEWINQTMKKQINEKKMKMTKLMVQLWKEIVIVINRKYLKKNFSGMWKMKKKWIKTK